MPKTTKTSKKTKGINVDAYAAEAESSARHFVALLADAILKLPSIKEKTQKKADTKAFKMLDSLFEAFVKAQVDAIKFAVADISETLGIEKPLYPLAN